MSDSSFNFHGLVSFHLYSEAEYAHDFFGEEYGWASGSTSAPAEIHLHWQHSAFPLFQRAAGAYHSHKLAARWRYQLEINEGVVKIQAAGTRIALTMVHHMLVHPSLRYLVSQQGVILLHGAALVRESASFIFTGVGGTGKTTTTSLLLDQGKADWQLHADDYVFISEAGETFPYLTRAHLYLELLHWVPSLKPRLTRAEKIKAWIFNLVLKISKKHIRWAVRLPLARLWPDRKSAEQADLAALLILERSTIESVEVDRIEAARPLLDDLIAMNMHEARHFLALLEKSIGRANAKDLVEGWRSRERSVLDSALSVSSAYRLQLAKFARGDSAAASLIEEELKELFEGSQR